MSAAQRNTNNSNNNNGGSSTHKPSSSRNSASNRKSSAGATTDPAEEPVEVSKVYHVSSRERYDYLMEEAGNKVVLIEFMAQWCGPCRIIGAKLEELAVQYENRAIIIKIDVDDFEELAIEHNVTMMPTFIIFKNKKKLDQFSGSSTEKIDKVMEKFCGLPTTSNSGIVDENQGENQPITESPTTAQNANTTSTTRPPS